MLLHQLVKYLQKHLAVKMNVLRCIFTQNLIILYGRTGLCITVFIFLPSCVCPKVISFEIYVYVEFMKPGINTMTPSKLAQATMLLTWILEEPGLNFCQDTGNLN